MMLQCRRLRISSGLRAVPVLSAMMMGVAMLLGSTGVGGATGKIKMFISLLTNCLID